MDISSRSERLAWPDMAKALCILLVVLMHCEFAYDNADWLYRAELKQAWHVMNEAIRPLRMPMFFLVSGLLASGSVMNPNRRSLQNRLHRPLYLYFLWGALLSWVLPVGFAPDVSDNIIIRLGMSIGLIATSSWYMLGLAIFFVLTKMTRGVSLIAVFFLCACLSAIGTIYQDMFVMHQSKLLRCLIFFVAGVRMRDQLFSLGDAASMSRTIAFGALFLIGSIALYGSDNYLLPVDLAAVVFGISLCRILVERKSLLRPARWLAQRTLPIYLLHFLMIPALAYLGTQILPQALLRSYWFGLIVPLLSLPVLIASSLIVHKLLMAAGATWLFDLPSRDRLANVPEWQPPSDGPAACAN